MTKALKTPGPDAAFRLARIRRITRLLDTAFTVPGTRLRIGLDPIIGLVPGLGDVLPLAASLYVVHEARQIGVSGRMLVMMLGNVGLDALVGAVPVLGDLFDFAFKANVRNLRLLERHLAAGHPAVSRQA